MKLIAAMVLILAPAIACADDGVRSDSESAFVERLVIYGSSYTLVVSGLDRNMPTKEYTPAFRGCEFFTVIGWFDKVFWDGVEKKDPDSRRPNPKNHKEALDALQKALEDKTNIGFGFVAKNGFRPLSPKASPLACTVESKGLTLANPDPFPIVISWGDGI